MKYISRWRDRKFRDYAPAHPFFASTPAHQICMFRYVVDFRGHLKFIEPMRLASFFVSLSVFIVATTVLGTVRAPLNPFSQGKEGSVYDIRFPIREIVRLKLEHARETDRYDVGLFGNSRSDMVGRAEFGLSECKFFNYSARGESIRNSLGLLEYLAAQGKAPRIALISFDHMELAMIANATSLPFRKHLEIAFRDLTFVTTSSDISVRDTARLAFRYISGVWRSLKSAFSSDWLLEAAGRILRGSLAPFSDSSNTADGYRSDGSFVIRKKKNNSPPPFKPAAGNEFIDALLVHDLSQFKALEGKGDRRVEKIIIYESPLSPPFDQRFAQFPRPQTAAHRQAYLDACRSLELTCFAAPRPNSVNSDKNVWRDASHPPAADLARYLRRLIDDSGGCNSVAISSIKAHGSDSP